MSKFTADQELAITKSGTNIIVSAGAGSGKTAVLTERTIRKILNGTNINDLLILTFTNAAASEMKDRIREALKSANLKEQLSYIDSAYITTFDSFSLSIVKKYHLYLDLSSNISIMDSSIEELKTNEILDYIFENSYMDNDFKKLVGDFCTKNDDSVKSVVKDIIKKLDLINDKDKYLDNYILNHYSDKKLDEYVKLFIDKVKEVKDSLTEPYKDLLSRVDKKFIQTYNLEPLLNSKNYIDIKNNLKLVGNPRKNKDCEDTYKIYKDKISSILKRIDNLTRFNDKEEMKNTILLTLPYTKSICKIIKKFYNLFLMYKKAKNLYTFSDIALMSIKVIKENKEVREEIRSSFKEIMVDEYQDTSDIQEEFISLIQNNNVYMVGDIKQSIYRFRHANPYIFKNKYNNYSTNNGGIKIDLLKNFRSRPEVLDNINLIFNLIMDNEVGDAEYKESHQMNFGNISYVNECKTHQNNNMDILTYNKELIEEFSNDEIEAFTIAYDIKDKINNKYKVVDKKTKELRECKYLDFAIIMDRGTSFDLYKKIFEYVGVPIIQIRNEKLTLGDDILTISNLINLIVKVNLDEIDDEFKYYYASISRSFIYKTPDEEIFDIVKSNKYFDTMLYKSCKKIDITELSNIELLNSITEVFDLYNKILTLNNIKETIIKIDYLKELSINLSNIGYTVVDFAKYLKEMIANNKIEYSLNTDNSNNVKLLNIHKSKGLEYNVCYFSGLYKKSNDEDLKSKFIVDLNNNIITPYIDNGIKQTILKDLLAYDYEKANISEKIRLFYVALTRTKEKMILLLPINKEKDSYNTLVPIDERLNYKRISDMLESIITVLKPYMKEINFNKVKLSRDFEKSKYYNYKSKIAKSNIVIKKVTNRIKYEEITENKFSKNIKSLITKEQYNNMKLGTKVHYIFETEDFKNTNDSQVLKFLKHIDNNYINCYKEYEFIYQDNNELKHGIIDLMLEYEKYIDIIDYKLKNILDDNYINQLNGYKEYIKTISNKDVNIYLYSILDDELRKLG